MPRLVVALLAPAFLPLVLAALGVALGGCSTKRMLTIQSDPPGARVYVNGEELGTTPVQVPFVHYGRFEVRLEKAGYESLAGDLHVPSQIDGYPVVDLAFELTVKSRHFAWTGKLTPVNPSPTKADAEAMLERARAFREETLRAVAEPGTPGRTPR